MSYTILTAEELSALSYWSIGTVQRAELPRDGTVNQTVLLETSRGSYALRTCQPTKQIEAVEKEYEVLEYVVRQGLPAIAPIALPNGLPYLNFGGRLYLLFPKAKGQQIPRAFLEKAQLESMGKWLAKLTLALTHYPTDGIFKRNFQFDVVETLGKLERLEKHIQQLPRFGADEKAALKRIHEQRMVLQQTYSVHFEQLRFQVSHGDFHDGNLFFENDTISAIIDWDQLRVTPCYFELLRTTNYLLSELHPSIVSFFVRTFLENFPLDKTELGQTVQLCTLEQAHNVWTLESVYLEGNDRARAFLRGRFANTFTPFEALWQRLEINT
ncbi:MAG: phosphotransferase enzyme family protein [Trueperaceae bacterium]